jgi:tocopherol cyclase
MTVCLKYSFLTFFFLLMVNITYSQYLHSPVHFSQHKTIPGYLSKKLKHPEMFQGNRKTKNYFEGWYFKMVSADGSSILSVIPGISLSSDGKDQHAFIQVIDGSTALTNYYTFPIEQFSFSTKEFEVKIGKNYFSANKIILNIEDDSTHIYGQIEMSNTVSFPGRKFLNSGIMGWYRFVPFMECYHGVVSLNHDLSGTITKDKKKYIFDNGLGYIEKDWGSSMPSEWIWMQTNHFNSKNSSFMLSIANIPWIGRSFTGFLGFFYHDGQIHRFATYTKAKLEIEYSDHNEIKIQIKDKKYTYNILASRNQAGLLKAPVKGSMDRRISESINAHLTLSVIDKQNNVIFSDSTLISGLELAGDIDKLKK